MKIKELTLAFARKSFGLWEAFILIDLTNQKSRKIMQNLMSFLLIGILFVSVISAQNTVVPIVIREDLIGGTQNGKWLTAEQTEQQMNDKTEYKAINFNEISLGVFVGTKADRGVCENARITFERLYASVEEDDDKSPLMLGTFADWDPLPRFSKKLIPSNKANQKIVADFLKTKGINKAKIEITQIFQIDLEGDGKKEIIIAANYYKKGESEEQNVGDYSFVLLRKIVNGKMKNILIDGEFFTAKLIQSGDFNPPNRREITAIADLNGDGKMEIVVSNFGYEAHSHAILEIKNEKLIKVLESECSV